MKRIFLLSTLAAALILTPACTDKNGNGGTSSTWPSFNIVDDQLSFEINGGLGTASFTFANRPEGGTFDFRTPTWVKNFSEGPDNTFRFSVDRNTSRDRTGEIAISYSYPSGYGTAILRDTIRVSQVGVDFDKWVEVNSVAGEYYTATISSHGHACYYVWCSDLGIYVEGSRGINFELYPAAAPVLYDSLINGNTYKRVRTIPAGEYKFDATTPYQYLPMTFNGRSEYGAMNEASNWQYYTDQQFVTGGSLVVTPLEGLEDTHVTMDARVTLEDGQVYAFSYTGSVDIAYIQN